MLEEEQRTGSAGRKIQLKLDPEFMYPFLLQITPVCLTSNDYESGLLINLFFFGPGVS